MHRQTKKTMNLFENTDNSLHRAVSMCLKDTLSTEQLISHVDEFGGMCVLTRKFYNNIEKWYADGKIRLVDSIWDYKPDAWLHLPEKPEFLNIENYRKINELSKNKNDWNDNWIKYTRDFPFYNNGDCHPTFYMSDAKNARMFVNKSWGTKLKMENFQFLIVVLRDSESYSSKNIGQEYLFEFTGKNPKETFVEKFRDVECSDIASNLIEKRKEQLLEEEVSKTISLFDK